ncbi:MAG: YcaQ family DNA glycosylase [Sciscionella sp.]|nr:YcaQ family DNA glycosylase [Sciscionella sp.]
MTAAAARRAALAAQGFADPPSTSTPTRRQLQRVLDRVQLLQLDSVNVAVRAHYMPLFSRLGAYSHSLVDDAAWAHSARRPRLLTEYWAHEASLLPVDDWPLFRWRMGDFQRRFADNPDSIAHRAPRLADKIVAAVAELGPIGAGELENVLDVPSAAPKPKGGWWNRSEVKRACEWLFATGALVTGTRNGFQRLYDLPERVLPDEVLAVEVDRADAIRQLVAKSATALGVATEPDLRDYYRLPPADSQRAVAELVDAGALEHVTVRGWTRPAYRRPDARMPRKIDARALLCPFDPLIFYRDRTHRMFDFHYRIEIYVPEPKRVHGYYVFPFLLGDELVARVDLKADRQAGLLRVNGAFTEAGVDGQHVATELASELRSMAEWLALQGVSIGDRGDLAPALRRKID